ncbi:MAG: FAD-binding oxidoreductase [Ectothiorhodospiraceae bacterium]|nr:FAD-binding oxidoreductase [Ectothiorhodospiraceae bacterium]
MPTHLDDVHAALNRTRVHELVPVRDERDVTRTLHRAAREGRPVAISGGRGAMGGQQFATGGFQLDMRGFDAMLGLDTERGLATLQAGATWPDILRDLETAQLGREDRWTIRQKQTGADFFTIGGSVSANAHGRGLDLAPLVQDVESVALIDAAARRRVCSRERDPALLGRVVGGYGLHGVVTAVTLRLARRHALERHVELRDADGLSAAFEARIRAGYTFGDFQFSCASDDDDFLRRGVFSCYLPVAEPPGREPRHVLDAATWHDLLLLAHVDKREAFRRYAEHYLRTDGQRYWSDEHQMSVYLPGYHRAIDHACGARHRGSEMITELYVPRARLETFLALARDDLRARGADVVYGTVRLIRADRETALPWAREDYACVIFNLHTEHTAAGVTRTKIQCRSLIDLALDLGGSFYLTYHPWARRDQLLAAYPALPAVLAARRAADPRGVLRSDWLGTIERVLAEAPEVGLARAG